MAPPVAIFLCVLHLLPRIDRAFLVDFQQRVIECCLKTEQLDMQSRLFVYSS